MIGVSLQFLIDTGQFCIQAINAWRFDICVSGYNLLCCLLCGLLRLIPQGECTVNNSCVLR